MDPIGTVAKHNLLRWAPLLEAVLCECQAQTGEDFTIAVHSSWRKASWATNSVLRQALGPLGHRFLSVTNPQMDRHAAIIDLSERCGIDDFLIVDDDRMAFAPSTPNLLVTNPLYGLSDTGCLDEVRRWACQSINCHALPVSVP